MPVMRNAHQTQLPATPPVRTISVTRLGVSVENVVATMETPSSHHGTFLPERKNEPLSRPARRRSAKPTASEATRKLAMMTQSYQVRIMWPPFRSGLPSERKC